MSFMHPHSTCILCLITLVRISFVKYFKVCFVYLTQLKPAHYYLSINLNHVLLQGIKTPQSEYVSFKILILNYNLHKNNYYRFDKTLVVVICFEPPGRNL